MSYIITLVAQDTLNSTHFDFIKDKQGDITWLSDEKAAQIYIENTPDLEDVQTLRNSLQADKIDIFCMPHNKQSENQRKKLLIADMDSTIVTGETLDDLAAEAGIKDKVSEITERAMRGEIDFFDAIRERVGLLKNLPIEALTRTLEHTEISKGAQTLVQTMSHHGAFCALVSGGFTFFTENIATQLGFDAHHGNILGINDGGQLTGEVIDPILDKNTKLELLNYYIAQQNLQMSDSISIGDGANDLMMLEASQNAGGLGIGYQPKPLLEERLINCIRHTDLTSVLYAQGYNATEFIS